MFKELQHKYVKNDIDAMYVSQSMWTYFEDYNQSPIFQSIKDVIFLSGRIRGMQYLSTYPDLGFHP